jgi:hypothetical protein
MKRLLPILTVFAVLFPAICFASGYVLVNYGVGGKIDEPSLGLELGGIFLSDLHPTGGALSLGLGVSVADTDENPPSGLQPLTTQAYDFLKKYNDGNEQEVDVTFGAEMIPAFFAVGGIGYASQDTKTIGTLDSKAYEVSTDTDKNATWMLGARYVIEGLNIGLGFHSRRGIMASVGIAF